MNSKLKNILIVLLVLMGLIFTSRVLANPSDKCDRIKDIQKEIEGIQEQIKETEKELDNCSSLLNESKRIQCNINYSAEIENLRKKLIAKRNEALTLEEDCPELYGEIVQNLDNEIKYLDALIEVDETKIKIKENEITTLKLNILKVQEEIKRTTQGIEDAKLKIAETIKSLYEYDSQNLVRLTLAQGNLSDFFDEIVYVNNLQESIGEALVDLKEDRNVLENRQKNLEEDEKKLEDQKQILNTSIQGSENLKDRRERLATFYGMKQEEFEQVLKSIKKQTQQLLGDLASLAQRNWAEIEKLKKELGEVGDWARFGVPIFLQTNYPGETLGPSSYSFYNYGCAVTSVAMVLNYQGKKNVSPMTLNHDYENIFSCSGSSGAFCWHGVTNSPYNMKISGTISHVAGGVNLNNYFVAGRPMVIFLNTSSAGSPVGHYVVITGKVNNKYVVIDPILSGSQYFNGPLYLEASIAAVESWYGRTVTVDQVIIYTP